MDAIKIVLADDHEIVRRGIRLLLAHTPDFEIIGEANNGQQALRLVREAHPDVLILDIQMPDMDGVEVARQLKRERSTTRVLVLSAYDDQEYILELLANGANGYLLKEDAPSHLISAIRHVAKDKQVWGTYRVAKCLDDLRKSMNYHATITFVEINLLKNYAATQELEEAARLTNLALKDAEAILKQLRSRMLVRTNDELLGVALGLGWLSLPGGENPGIQK